MPLNINLDTSSFDEAMGKMDRQSQRWADEALEEMADTLLLLSRAEVPHDTGRLSTSGQVFKDREGYGVAYNTEYATYQHEGARFDGSHKIRNYQKGRKGKYLEDPLKMNIAKWRQIFMQRVQGGLKGI